MNWKTIVRHSLVPSYQRIPSSYRCNKKLLKFTSNRQDPSRWILALDRQVKFCICSANPSPRHLTSVLLRSGPLTLLSLPTFGSPADLARIYLHGGFPEAAVRLLKALHWNSQPEECCATLTAVLPALLTRPALKENVGKSLLVLLVGPEGDWKTSLMIPKVFWFFVMSVKYLKTSNVDTT